jgi:hypothetical protein
MSQLNTTRSGGSKARTRAHRHSLAVLDRWMEDAAKRTAI